MVIRVNDFDEAAPPRQRVMGNIAPLHPVLDRPLKSATDPLNAAREMIHTMQRRRRAAEERAEHRSRWLITGLMAFVILGMVMALATSNVAVKAILWPLVSMATGVAIGVTLRGRL